MHVKYICTQYNQTQIQMYVYCVCTYRDRANNGKINTLWQFRLDSLLGHAIG